MIESVEVAEDVKKNARKRLLDNHLLSSQTVHGNGFISTVEWTSPCIAKLLLVLNALPHKSHMNVLVRSVEVTDGTLGGPKTTQITILFIFLKSSMYRYEKHLLPWKGVFPKNIMFTDGMYVVDVLFQCTAPFQFLFAQITLEFHQMKLRKMHISLVLLHSNRIFE